MKKHILLSLLACVCILCTLAGCPSETPEKTAMVLILGEHANAAGLNLTNVREKAQQIIEDHGYIGVIAVDGAPDVVFAKRYTLPEEYKRTNKVQLQQLTKERTASLRKNLQNVAADDPEVDYLSALHLASRILRSLDGDGTEYDHLEILVVGSGLNTTGAMNFQNNLISADPAVTTELLTENSEIPDLTGISVTFYQLGDTAEPQMALSRTQRKNLVALYEAIVTAGGGTFHNNTGLPTPAEEDRNLPYVTPIVFPQVEPLHLEPVLPESPAETEAAEMREDAPETLEVFLTDEQIAFCRNEAVFLSETDALDTLRPIAAYLAAHPEVKILCAGTTAGDIDTDFSLYLSKSRAQTVSDALVLLGVEKERVTAVGLGAAGDPWHIYGIGYDDNRGAASNRKVIITDADSETARLILQNLSDSDTHQP